MHMYITMSNCVLVHVVIPTVCVLSASMFTVSRTRLYSLAEMVLNYFNLLRKPKTLEYDCMYEGIDIGDKVMF